MDCSVGELEAFFGELCGSDKLLRYIDFEITYTSMVDKAIKSIGHLCSQLKSFAFNTQWCKFYLDLEFSYGLHDEVALTATFTVHELRRPQAIRNKMINVGLLAILNSCTQLDSLDIRGCFNAMLEDDLRAKLSRIREVRLPDESTKDYPYITIAEVDIWKLKIDYDYDLGEYNSNSNFDVLGDPEYSYGLPDDVALRVTFTVHELRCPQAIRNKMTNAGLLAIVNSCTQLDSLDIRGCFNAKLDDDLRAKLSGIREVRLPDKFTKDIPYITMAKVDVWKLKIEYDSDLGVYDSDSDSDVPGGQFPDNPDLPADEPMPSSSDRNMWLIKW
ncbi:hypothetical protein J5N97_017671 [Dioscorea zingiberensis]|uniref:F-box protein n=1 Tax=Dioscorea zingiberensis TaxID=325984 RepID=A0A9D5HGF6_9LILI|nr:hypothetical protein J5N97_017671 [Dioscorea zingiberensis]